MSKTNDYVNAQLSDLVYYNPKLEKGTEYQDLPAGWEYIASSGNADNHEGYFGAAFRNGNNVIIVHRGTHNPQDEDNINLGQIKNYGEFLKDLDDDIQVWLGKTPDQYKHALEFTNKVMNSVGKDVTISCTGHSLGGGICQLISIVKNIEATTYDAVGVYETARKLFTPEQIQTAKITSYASAPNFFNTFSKQIKPPIQLKFETPAKGDTYVDYKDYSLDQHSMKNIANQFDSETGPKDYIQPDKWLGSKGAYKNYLKGFLATLKEPYTTTDFDKKDLIALGVEPERIIEEDLGSNYETIYSSGVSAPEVRIRVLPKQKAAKSEDNNKEIIGNQGPWSYQEWFDPSSYKIPIFGQSVEELVKKAWSPSSSYNANGNAKIATQYKIEKGDNLWNIAREHKTTVEAILLLPGNQEYLKSAKLNSKKEVAHVLIKEGEVLELPEAGSKLYAGDAKQRIINILEQEDAEITNVNVIENVEGESVSKVKEDAKVTVDGEEINAKVLIEADMRQDLEQLKFFVENFIKVDESINSIYKFTDKVYDKLFSTENIQATSSKITAQLLNGDKVEKVARNLIKTTISEVAVEGISLPIFAKPYEKLFGDSIGKDIVSGFATTLLPNLGSKISSQDLRMMAYSSATNVLAQKAVNNLLAIENPILKSSVTNAFAGTALSVIALKGRLDGDAVSNIVSSSITSYASNTVASGLLASTGLANLGILAGPVGVGITLGVQKLLGKTIGKAVNKVCRAFGWCKKKKNHVEAPKEPLKITSFPIEASTYIESHSARINKDGVLELVTLRPEGTIIHELSVSDKTIYARGASDVIISGPGNDIIKLIGLEGGFVQSGDNKPRVLKKIVDRITKEEISTYIYLERIIGSPGDDNNLDGQDGDDHISGMGGNDNIKGGKGHDFLEGGVGNDIIEGGEGDDTIDGGVGDDLIDGGSGNDSIYAGFGNDGTPERPISGGGGDDKISGGSGVDFIDGGDGNNLIILMY